MTTGPLAPWDNPDVILFHGTDNISAGDIVKNGVRLDVGREENEFGRGFYTTTSYSQANDWARVKAIPRKRTPVVLTFRAELESLARLESLFFVRATNEFWRLVA